MVAKKRPPFDFRTSSKCKCDFITNLLIQILCKWKLQIFGLLNHCHLNHSIMTDGAKENRRLSELNWLIKCMTCVHLEFTRVNIIFWLDLFPNRNLSAIFLTNAFCECQLPHLSRVANLIYCEYCLHDESIKLMCRECV